MACKAFGFTIRLRIANHRIQMRAGECCLTIGEGNVVPTIQSSYSRFPKRKSVLRVCATSRAARF
jgi:hypothetical protein